MSARNLTKSSYLTCTPKIMCGHTASHCVTVHSTGFLKQFLSGNGCVRKTIGFLFSLSSKIVFLQCDRGPLKPRFRASSVLEQALKLRSSSSAAWQTQMFALRLALENAIS